MKFDIMLTGVGGEGVLTAASIIARAANYEGLFVRGVQLHGLSQRGGSIPTFVRFGAEGEISSPGIMQGNANLVLAFEPLEAVRAVFYARKEKTTFVINNWPHMPVYANLLDLPYPSIEEIVKRIERFSAKTLVFDAHGIAKEKFGSVVLGNTILIGAALGAGVLPLKEKSLRTAVIASSPRNAEDNLKAFEMGITIGKKASEQNAH